MFHRTFAVGLAPAVCLLVSCAPGADSAGSTGIPAEASTEAGAFLLTLSHAPDPPTAGDATLDLTVRTPDQSPVTGATITVTPWMTAHDHGVSEPPVVAEQGDGAYRATWAWSMPGVWELTVAVAAADGTTDQAVFDVEVE